MLDKNTIDKIIVKLDDLGIHLGQEHLQKISIEELEKYNQILTSKQNKKSKIKLLLSFSSLMNNIKTDEIHTNLPQTKKPQTKGDSYISNNKSEIETPKTKSISLELEILKKQLQESNETEIQLRNTIQSLTIEVTKYKTSISYKTLTPIYNFFKNLKELLFRIRTINPLTINENESKLSQSEYFYPVYYKQTYKKPSKASLQNIQLKNELSNDDISIVKLIEQSEFFDPKYYLREYPEVRKSGISPVIHFHQNGYKENKNPGKYFNTNFYLETYKDVKENGVNPLYHFLIYGQYEGRKPLPDVVKKSILYSIRKSKTLSSDVTYNSYLYKYFLTPKRIKELNREINNFEYQPTFSIIVPVYNVEAKWLNQCIESVINQIYSKWELCIHDDASTNKETIKCLKRWDKKDTRIKVSFGNVNQHISGASNEAIKMASGEYISLLDNDDTLTPNALFEIARVLNEDNKLDFIYSDEDKIETNGTYSTPHFKPDFCLDLLLSNNYICHFSTIRKTLGDQIGWFRKGFEGSQDHDLFIRIIEQTSNIKHIPKILYHWRKIPGSTAATFSDKNYATDASVRALSDYLNRNNINGVVKKDKYPGTYRIYRQISEEEKISIIIPFKDHSDILKTCIESIINKTDYKNYEIILVSNNSKEKETFNYIEVLLSKFSCISFYEYNTPFNYSKINNWAVKKAKGKYILLLNNDTEVIDGQWLNYMVEHIQRNDVGAVGAKLLYPDNTIQHAGVIIGIGGVANHAHKDLPDQHPGYFCRAEVVSEFSACTAACLLIKKTVFNEVKGLNEDNLKIAFNDVDLCLKIREAGYKIIYTPYAKLYHFESKSRGLEDTPEKNARFNKEINYMMNKWKTHEYNDPFYNVNLSRTKVDFSLNI